MKIYLQATILCLAGEKRHGHTKEEICIYLCVYMIYEFVCSDTHRRTYMAIENLPLLSGWFN